MRVMRLLALVLASIVALAACGDSAVTTTDPPVTTTPSPATTEPAPTTTAPPATTTTARPATTTTAPPTTTSVPSTTTSAAGQPADAATAAAVQAALAAGAEVPTGRMEGSFQIIGLEGAPPGTDVAFTFSGAFDNTIPATTFVMDLGELAAAAGDEIPPGFEDLFAEMEIRQIGDTAYMRFPFFTEFLGVPTEWVSFPSGSADPTAGIVAGTPGNPADVLGAFDSAGATVLEAGPDPIRGFDTTRYVLIFDVEELAATADPEDLAALEELGPLGVEEFAVDVWIDPDGLLHRFEMTFDGSQLGDAAESGGFERMTMRFDILDHGAPVEIVAPPADQVTDGEGLGIGG